MPPGRVSRVFRNCVTLPPRSDPAFVANDQNKWLTRARSKRVAYESCEIPREPLEIPPNPPQILRPEAKKPRLSTWQPGSSADCPDESNRGGQGSRTSTFSEIAATRFLHRVLFRSRGLIAVVASSNRRVAVKRFSCRSLLVGPVVSSSFLLSFSLLLWSRWSSGSPLPRRRFPSCPSSRVRSTSSSHPDRTQRFAISACRSQNRTLLLVGSFE